MNLQNFKPIDISQISPGRNRIHRIGIELEGGWINRPNQDLEHDGSIRFVDPDAAQRWNFARLTYIQERVAKAQDNLPRSAWTATRNQIEIEADTKFRTDHPLPFQPPFIGEMPSPPLCTQENEVIKVNPARNAGLRQAPAPFWKDWITANYPSHVNDTCGLHVHMSFRSGLTYQRLMDGRYPRTIIEEFLKWAKEENLPKDHPIWGRLADRSRYCQHQFYADAQAIQTQKGHRQDIPGHRYTVVSFQYTRLGTLECRLLPMFDEVEQAKRAIQFLMDITNKFLMAVKAKEVPFKITLPVDDSMHQVEMVERI